MINLNNPPMPLIIGRQGENQYCAIEFDVSDWLSQYPDGAVSIIFERPDGEKYPVVVGAVSSPAVWTPSAADTAVSGYGKLELRISSGEVLGKSTVIQATTIASINGDGTAPPPPEPDWTQEVANNAASAQSDAGRAETARDRAEAAAIRQPVIGDNSNWWVWDIDTGVYADTGLAAPGPKGDTGAAIEYAWDNTRLGVRVEGQTEYAYTDLEGEKGDTGNGVATIERTGGTGAPGTTDTYTITYTSGATTTFPVYNGANGRGIASVIRTAGDGSPGTTDTYTINFTDGTSTDFSVYNGADGELMIEDIVDDLTTGGSDKVLSAEQGKVLKGLADGNAQQISQLDADYTIKIATVENELNTCKSVLSNININNEATQTATGYGIVTLPKNAANGHMGVKVEGVTATNLVTNGNFANGTTGWKGNASTNTVSDGVLSNTGNGAGAYPNIMVDASYRPAINAGHKVYAQVMARVTTADCLKIDVYALPTGGGTNLAVDSVTPPTQNTNYLLSGVVTTDSTYSGVGLVLYMAHVYVNAATANGKVLEVKKVLAIDLTATFGAGNEPDKETCDAMFANWFDGTKSVQTPLRVRSVSSDETQSSALYIPDVGVLRSLEAVADELTATEHIKRIDDNGTALATPITTPIQSSGTLVAYPSGTVYIEKAIADAGIYDSGITVLNTDKPISMLESLSKIDFATGQPTPLDASTAVIAGDGLSFTHTGLSDGDIVFFTYFYSAESTEGETSLTYYDSRYVIQDSVNSKFYKWAITSANGVPSIGLVEV